MKERYIVRKGKESYKFSSLAKISTFINLKYDKVSELLENGSEYNGYTVDELLDDEDWLKVDKNQITNLKKEISRLNGEIDEVMQGWRTERDYLKKQIFLLKQQLKNITEWAYD